MNVTPKINRNNLALKSRIIQKRRLSMHGKGNSETVSMCTPSKKTHSPSITICFDGSVESTPPHKQYNLDDSISYSPLNMDRSFSPNLMFSQTLASNSPEVGWRWCQRSKMFSEQTNTSPDSAYTADSSFNSLGSSTEGKVVRNVGELVQQRLRHDIRREEQRKAIANEIRRAEQSRVHELLRKRCDQFKEQLKEIEVHETIKEETSNNTNNTTTAPNNIMELCKDYTEIFTNENDISIFSTSSALKKDIAKTESPKTIGKNDSMLTDFLNDSDFDDLLIETTQSVESKILKSSQDIEDVAIPQNAMSDNKSNLTNTNTKCTSAIKNKEQRSSLYMKFLEDDSHDDWFNSLDDIILEATQSKKPRNSFQRYKSMPANPVTTSADTKTSTAKSNLKPVFNQNNAVSYNNSSADEVANTNPKIKRHASSHLLDSSASNYRKHQLHLRK